MCLTNSNLGKRQGAKAENILMKGRATIAQGLKHERTFGVVSTNTNRIDFFIFKAVLIYTFFLAISHVLQELLIFLY